VRAEMEMLAELGVPEEPPPGDTPPAPLALPFARRDLDRLRLILAAQGRLREVQSSPRVKKILAGRGYFDEALRWLEIHGGVQGQELAAHWRSLDLGDVASPVEGEAVPGEEAVDASSEAPSDLRPRRRRRRRRRRPPTPSTPDVL
jgi:hypothetical protein